MDPGQKDHLAKLGANIRKARKDKQLSLAQVAAFSDLEKANLSRLENGRSNPSLLTLLRIGQAIGCDVTTFFDGIHTEALRDRGHIASL